MQLQQKISAAKLQQKVGKTLAGNYRWLIMKLLLDVHADTLLKLMVLFM